MKFLILTQYFVPEIGATPIRLASVARELRQAGHEVAVVTAMPNHPHGRIFPEYAGSLWSTSEWEGIPVHRVWLYASTGAGLSRMAGYFSFAAMALAGLFRAGRPDYVLIESPPPTVALPGILAARIWRSGVILYIADLWPDSITALGLSRNRPLLAWLRFLERWMYRHADYINAITLGVKHSLESQKGIEPERVLYLPNGVDPAAFFAASPDRMLQRRLGLPENVFLYAGNMGFAHGLDIILEAAHLLRSRTDVHFLFLGDGSERRRMEALAEEMRLPNVTFHDPVPACDVPRFASLAKAAIVPQRDLPLFNGNRPAKLFSMMGCGKPIFFCGKGEAADLVREAGCGVVTPPEDAPALADAIERALADAGELASMGRAGRRFVEERYSWSRLVRDWLADLENRLGRVVPAVEEIEDVR
ncbi:MAG TPA: glycosyltransferase family 4 protein [Bryobacteraceae bacterium]